jgi:hypothetical protein
MQSESDKKFLREMIDYLSAIPEDKWLVDRVAENDRFCVMGHIFNRGKDDAEGNYYWNAFENIVATTFMIYPVNDGRHKDYQQPTAKQRNLAYLNDVLNGEKETTHECMDRCMRELNNKENSK